MIGNVIGWGVVGLLVAFELVALGKLTYELYRHMKERYQRRSYE